MRTRYIFKDGKMLEYKEYVELYGKPEQRGSSGGTTIINKSFDAYESPSSGKTISTHADRRDDLARTGCVDYDPDIRQDHDRDLANEEIELDRLVDAQVDKEFSQYSTEEMQAVERELSTTTDEYTRSIADS